jgi:hypothetical protein
MTKEQILNFAFNRKPSTKGLVYSYIVDESNKIIITPKGFMGDDMDMDICIHIVDSENINTLPTESEIEKALDEFISLNGRDVFKLTK